MRNRESSTMPTLWKNYNVWLLLGGQWVSQMGNAFFTIAAFWYVLADTHSRLALGFVGAAAAVGGIFSIVTGVWVDRWDRRRTMIGTDSARFVLMTGAYLSLVLLRHLPLGVLLGIVVGVNLGGALFSPAQFALVPDVVSQEDLGTVNGIDQSASSVAQWIGYSLGGFIMGIVGVVGLVGSDAVTFLISAATLLGLRVPRKKHARLQNNGLRSVWSQIVAGQRVIWSHNFLKRAMPTALVVNFAMMTLTVLDVAWARQVLHGNATVYGLLESAFLVGAVAGGLLFGRIPATFVLKSRIILCLSLAGVALVGFSLVQTISISLASLGVVGMAFGILNATMATMIQQLVSTELLGRIGGSIMAISAVSTPLGAVLAGWAGSRWPLPAVFCTAGILVALMALPFIWISQDFNIIQPTVERTME